MTEITQKQQKMLEPFGMAFAAMGQQVRAMSDETLRDMLQACYVTSVSNCWCCTFEAAQWLQRELRREKNHREKMAAPRVRESQ